MNKFAQFIIAQLFVMQCMKAVIIENKFGNPIIFFAEASNLGDSWHAILRNKSRDIGNDEIRILGVGTFYGFNWGTARTNLEAMANGGNANDVSTSIALKDKYSRALTKLPNAVITIIKDPTNPKRPLAILPIKELDEFLLKEHQAKVKPEIQAAGKELLSPVYLPEDLANIAAQYTSPE